MNFSFSLYFMGDLAQLNCPGQVREILINQRGGNQQTVHYISGVYSFEFRRRCGNLSSITFFSWHNLLDNFYIQNQGQSNIIK